MNKKTLIYTFLFVIFSIFLIAMMPNVPLSVKPMKIIENSKGKAEIVLPKGSNKQLQNAAIVLQNYIFHSTGVNLPIVTSVGKNIISIHIGATSFAKSLGINFSELNGDGFILHKIDNYNFLIIGGSDYGSENGIYSFLERFVGVSWLMPTETGIYIPKKKEIILPDGKIIENPFFLNRQLSPINTESKDAEGQWGRFNRLKSNVEFHHNMKKLFDPTEFGKSNPLFYSEVDGKRIVLSKSATGKTWQPNFSATGISDSAANKIIRYFQKYPQRKSFSLGVNDGGKFDESEASKKRRTGRMNYLGLEDVSNDYFTWANQVVTKVTKIFPDKLFGLLAYSNVAEPPSSSVGVNSNIIPFITYERMRWADSTLERQGHELNNAWAAEANMLGWYDYAYGLNYLAPRVWFHEMQDYLQWGAQHKVKYYYAELYPNWGEGPKPWVQAKLLWNPYYNVDSLLDVWYVSFAGSKSAPKLKAFYSMWETFWTKDIYSSTWDTNKGQYWPFNNYGYLDAVPKDYVINSDKIIKASYSLASTDAQKQRVQKLLEMWEIYKTAINIWQDSDLPINKKNESLINSSHFISLLNTLEKDPLHSLSIQRIKLSLKIK